jgi:hypothetical protein
MGGMDESTLVAQVTIESADELGKWQMDSS